MDKEYNFQILLPNGTSVRLKLRIPEVKMPLRDFIKRVEEEYIHTLKQSGSLERKHEINWKGGGFLLVDADDMEIQNVVNFMNFNPQECHILRLQDGLRESATTFENMWDLTPDTDILKELPHEYTFLTALADMIDNSLQAICSNERRDIKYISVDVDEDVISIFDTGPGMDGSDENSIVKWGKVGASLHRFNKEQAIGGKPPYLKPFFGLFGYGGPIASMKLGRRALVSSKTKDSNKVYTLNLDRDALLSGSNWKTGGNMRDPEEDEISRTPHGSFTKVEISEPKLKLDTSQLQCKLKDIYFPYIQYDEDIKSGKTIMPVKFEVNGVDLAEIQGGEIAITNLHSCNGPDFVFQLQFSCKQDNMSKCKSFDLKTYAKANARLKCVYFPIVKGKENIDRILEGLESEKCGTSENFETFSRVSIRRLGRLLPDARWGLLPFMDLKKKRGDMAQLLKRCCMRVKCFIETDGGFNPTSSKTDLAHHSPLTTALRNFSDEPLENENDIKVQIYKEGKLLNPSQLKKDYEDWIVQMHSQYDDDDEADCGEAQPVFVVSPENKKELRISSEVARVHKSVTRNGRTWKCGQRIKLLKGACAGVQKNNVYATIEYFLLEGLQGESGGEAEILCRPSSLSDEKGCILSVNEGDTNLDMGESLSVPFSVVDAGKCIAVERTEWENHIERRPQKSPSSIELLDAEQCQELEVDGLFQKGTTAGVLKYNEGIVGFIDSRGTVHFENKKEYIEDSRVKFRTISTLSNLFFMGVGDARKWEHLAKVVKFEVRALEQNSKNVVSAETASRFAQNSLNMFRKINPENRSEFRGFIVGSLPSKEYQAYVFFLCETTLWPLQSLNTEVPRLLVGSGADYANDMLNQLGANLEMPENMAKTTIATSMLYASFNKSCTGGPTHVFLFRHGENMNIDACHDSLEPCTVHLENSGFYFERILLILIERLHAGPYTEFEQHLSSCPEVLCAARVVEKKKYNYYRVFYDTSQSASSAFDTMIKKLTPQSDMDLYPLFERVMFDMGGRIIPMHVGKCSQKLLEFMSRYI